MNNKYLQKIVKSLLYAAIMFLLLPVISYAGGTTEVISVTVPGFTGPKNAIVYLPEGYDPYGNTTYRVVYFLHGINNTHTGYAQLYPILDQLIDNNTIEPVILVKPDGSAPYVGSFFTNSSVNGPFEDWIYNYLINYIDANYKTKADRNDRVIFGHSMGGYGAMKMALKHADLYRAVASHSAPLDFRLVVTLVPSVIAEAGGGPPYTYIPGPTKPMTTLAYTWCRAFSPNPANPPFLVDFMLNNQGQIIPAVFALQLTHSPTRLARNITTESNLAVYFDCGIQDDYGFIYWNNAFKDTLNLLNIPYIYQPFTGGHINKLFTERIPISLNFLDSVMTYPEDALNALTTKIDGFDLEFGITTALKAKINSALNYWAVGDYDSVCSSVQAFINFVNAQTGKKLTQAQADILLNDANSIRSALDCGSVDNFAEVNNGPSKYELKQNYPNPFNPVTTISFAIPDKALVELKVYDILGREVASLINEVLDAGSHYAEFDASDLASGIYLYVLKSGSYIQSKKMLLIK